MTNVQTAESMPVALNGDKVKAGDIVIRARFNDEPDSARYTIDAAVADVGDKPVMFDAENQGFIVPIVSYAQVYAEGIYRMRPVFGTQGKTAIKYQDKMLVRNVINDEVSCETSTEHLVNNELFARDGRAWEVALFGRNLQDFRPLTRGLRRATGSPEITVVVDEMIPRKLTDSQTRASDLNWVIGQAIGTFLIVPPQS